MSEAKFSPGPWFCDGAVITHGPPERGGLVLWVKDLDNRHDARLIAAAPELVEALEAVAAEAYDVAGYCNQCGDGKPDHRAGCDVASAHALLERVRGR